MIIQSWSTSDSPANKGSPVCISTSKHPTENGRQTYAESNSDSPELGRFDIQSAAENEVELHSNLTSI